MTTGIIRTIDISYTAPEPPTPQIPRPNLIQTILQLFAANTDAVCVEAHSGYGKTTLLQEFASTATNPCFSTFLKPSSRLSYDPVLVRADLANQAFWYLKGTTLPYDREPTDGELRSLWSRCARLLLRERTNGYIIIDGLHHISSKEQLILSAILDLLPIGVKPFHFVFSGQPNGAHAIQERFPTIKPFTIPTFTSYESDEYLREVVPSREVRTSYHTALGGIPTLLASVRRQHAVTGMDGEEQQLPSTFDLHSLFEAEWNLIEDVSETIKTALAYLIAFGYPAATETISRYCNLSVTDIEEGFSCLPFLTLSQKTNGWEFSSETFGAFVEEKLSAQVREATEKIAVALLENPDSDASLTHLPLYLERTGNTGTLLEWLHEGRLASILHKTRTIAGLDPTLRNAISVSHSGKNDGALATYSLARSAIYQLAQTTGMEDEIRARSALGDVDGALAVANDATLLTHRLRLLAICADALAKTPGFQVQSLMDEIRTIFRTLEIGKLSSEEAIDLATDLYPIDPTLALELLKESIEGEVEDKTFEIAVARVSLSALQSRAAIETSGEGIGQRSLPKELIADKKLQRLLEASAVFFGEKTGQEVLKATDSIDDATARLFIQRKWLAGNPEATGALDVAERALRDAISETDFVPTATFYREVATTFPYAVDVERRSRLIAIIEGQHPIFSSKGPSVDVVRMQLILARCSFQDENLEEAASRLDDAYLDAVEQIDELETRIACLGWFVSELCDFDPEDSLVRHTRIKALVVNEFKKTLNEIVTDGADQLLIVEEALRALAVCNPSMAIEVCQRLNTIDRRNAAFSLVVKAMCRAARKQPDNEVILYVLGLMSVGEEKDGAIEAIANRVHRGLADAVELLDYAADLLVHIAQCFSSVTKVKALSALAIASESDKATPELREEIHGSLIAAYECIDGPGVRYRVACQLVKTLRPKCPPLAQRMLGHLQDVENRSTVSENVEQGMYFLCDLVARASYALASAGLLGHTDIERVCAVFAQVEDSYRKISALSTLAFYLWREKQSWCFSNVVNEHLWPSLDDLSEGDCSTAYRSWREAYPVVWLDDRDRARNAVADFPSEARNECTSAIIYALLNRQPYGEPFEHSGRTRVSFSYSDIQNLLHLCEETDEDNLILIVFERIADSLSGQRGNTNISRDQRADVSRRMLELATQRLPIAHRIEHLGYQVLCKAHALRVHEPDAPTWTQIIGEGRSIENAADRVFVLTQLAGCLRTNKRGRRNQLYGEAEKLAGELRSTEDRYSRFFSIAEVASDKDKALASKSLRKAFSSVVDTKGKRGAMQEHRLLDLAYRIDPELPMKFAMLHDDDPAREQYRRRAKKQIAGYKLRGEIGDPRSCLDLSSQKDNPDLAYAAWKAVGGLNSGRLIATDIVRLREMLVCASNYPLETSYPMYSWVITNIMMKYGNTKDANKYIRELFDGIVRGVEFYFLVSGGNAGLSEHKQWRESGEETAHILVHHGEKEKATGFIRNWIEESAGDWLTLVDPYFGPEELDFFVMVMEVRPSMRIQVLTSRKHHRNHKDGLQGVYSAAWRALCDQSPPEVEIMVVGTEGSGAAPFHDRWILSNEVGLRLGTSLNSLGLKDSEISVLDSGEVGRIENTVNRYLTKDEKEVEGERIRYESFELW